MGFFDLIFNKPLGKLLGMIYEFVGSYGLALILFTIAVRLLILPLSVNQQKSSVRMAALQPKVKELEKKHKGDKQKHSEELMKLYKEEGVNPAGGCLPLLIQLPILFGLYSVINRPLTYIIGFTQDQIQNIVNVLNLGIVANQLSQKELVIAEALKLNIAKFPEFANIHLIDFNFLGMNLALTPQWNSISILWVIPILAAIASYLSISVTTKINPATAVSNEQTKSMNKSMMFMMPLMSLWFSFTMPAGVGVYWIMSSVLMIGQQYLLNWLIPLKLDSKNKPAKKGE